MSRSQAPQYGNSAERAGSTESAELRRFPALAKLAWQRRRAIAFVPASELAAGSAACLAMVMGYHGRDARMDDVRQALGMGAGSADPLAILRAAESFGLRGRAIKLELGDLRYLPRASMLQWKLGQFVVLDRVRRGGADIVDPEAGPRFVPTEQLRRSFTGLALALEPSEAFAATPAGKSRLWVYLQALLYQRTLLRRIVVTSVLLRLFALSLPVLTALIVDRVVPQGDPHLLLVVTAGMAAVLGFQLVSELIRAHLILQLRTSLDTRMSLGFLDHLVSLPYEFFQKRSGGDLLMRVNSNTEIREQLTTSTISALLDGSLVLIYLLLIFWLHAGLGLMVLGLGALQIAVLLLAQHRYRRLMAQSLETQARTQSYLLQLLAGIETLKLSGAEHRAVQRWSQLFVDELEVALERGRLAAVIESLQRVLQAGSPLILLSYGAILVMAGQLSLGTMLATSALAVGFLTPLATLVDSALRLQLLGSYIERIEDVLGTEVEQDPSQVVQAPKLSGKIELKSVSFRYGPQAPLVVKDVSLGIEPGAQVAIVGQSGSGKSTLAALLIGLYRPSDGRILYDGQSLGDLDVRSVRRQLGVVPQHPYIFSGSIRDNIAMTSPDAHHDRIVAAARQACIHDDIMAMPMGYDTLVADGGSTLSGGQRQRLALARALLVRPAILLLDEATSALDSKTEGRVMEQLESFDRGGNRPCTRIVIAHRLSTVVHADPIIVMKEGSVVEVGTHQALLRQGGVYSQLIAAQTELGEEPG